MSCHSSLFLSVTTSFNPNHLYMSSKYLLPRKHYSEPTAEAEERSIMSLRSIIGQSQTQSILSRHGQNISVRYSSVLSLDNVWQVRPFSAVVTIPSLCTEWAFVFKLCMRCDIDTNPAGFYIPRMFCTHMQACGTLLDALLVDLQFGVWIR